MRIETSTERHPFSKGGDLRITACGFWLRLAAYVGEAPGSHTGFWRTNAYGLRGLNYRVGDIQQCMTVMVHWRSL